MCHITDVALGSGTIHWRDGHTAIGGLPARDNHTPIGMALGAGWDDKGRLLYSLIVHGGELSGRWVVIDR